jgi:mannose-1-phosphate guanylyltransferase
MIEEQLRAVGVADALLILEPAGRNTAPAIAAAALRSMPRCRSCW